MGQKIVVLGTGGTIAGSAASGNDNVGYRAAQLCVDELLAGLALPEGVDLVSEQLTQLDSKDMNVAAWASMVTRAGEWLERSDCLGVVLTHGTDTLEESAYVLHRLLACCKPVVFACAMRPATSVQADGPQNLIDAITLACHPGAQGVMAVCASEVHGGADVQKVHTYRLDAFSSGDAGPVARIEEGRVRQFRAWPALTQPLLGDPANAARQLHAGLPWVEILMSSAGADPRHIRALVEAGVRGLVVAGTGNGTIHQAWENELAVADSRGVAVLRVSRCAGGVVIATAEDRWPAVALGAAKARVELQLRLLAATA